MNNRPSTNDKDATCAEVFVVGVIAALCVAMAGALLAGSGCASAAQLVLRPNSPTLITEGEGRLRVSAWSEADQSLVDIGWVDAASAKGWTLTDYDWRP